MELAEARETILRKWQPVGLSPPISLVCPSLQLLDVTLYFQASPGSLRVLPQKVAPTEKARSCLQMSVIAKRSNELLPPMYLLYDHEQKLMVFVVIVLPLVRKVKLSMHQVKTHTKPKLREGKPFVYNNCSSLFVLET